jgi:AraC family transcriptional regulator, regulatory protein of adaptative response / methylated-DNA-[protein]-cysteine methyltransferase
MLMLKNDDDVRWAAVMERRAASPAFVYAVTTTGIFCRPTCSSRRPLRANTRFFGTNADAEAAGFRGCRRCRPEGDAPDAEQARLIGRICRLIDDAETPPSLGELAAQAHMSPHHFHRVFRALVGVTPKAYAGARRRERLQRALPQAATVTEAAYGSGYNSSSRFYANAASELGMSPAAYRGRGANDVIRYAIGQCSLGSILVAVTQRGVCAIDLGDDAGALQASLVERFARATVAPGDATLERHLADAIALVDGPAAARPEIALDIAGTSFAQRVWSALREIPYGETATYGAIAEAIGAPGAARAVAKACASNPVAVAIPCHRVVREDGADTGYRWGAQRKRELLRRERRS